MTLMMGPTVSMAMKGMPLSHLCLFDTTYASTYGVDVYVSLPNSAWRGGAGDEADGRSQGEAVHLQPLCPFGFGVDFRC